MCSVLAHPDLIIPDKALVRLQQQIAQRARHIPLAYIRKRSFFYGREFYITEDVLVPRPETENMISLLKKLAGPSPLKIADVGTGSGCLAITAALEVETTYVDAYDISKPALAVARRNNKQWHTKVHCHKNDLLDGITKRYDIVLANLPYVPDEYAINTAAAYEPGVALFAGPDGLDIYRCLFGQTRAKYILTEALPSQQMSLTRLAHDHSYELLTSLGYIQAFVRL